ncbi:cation channel sperm-associated auxiliary subunit epsilon-like isoform X2 [Pocillopora verrucosa]|uniref:cation channel sperm-associated auxiliary subunit epsilon-like isoform X2 n=1 Tax=Pocillopora verrucosa TaxID=203993 RepID=UPI00333E37F4
MSEAIVKLALFSAENLLVLLESGQLLIFNGTGQTWGNPLGLPNFGLTGLASHKICFEGANSEIMKNLVLGWSNESSGNRIYLSKNSGVSFQQLLFPTQSFSVISVLHVELHCFFPVATFLVNTTSYQNLEKTMFMQYDFMEDAWIQEELTLSGFSRDPPSHFSFIPPSTQYLIAWGQKLFAFGRLNGTGSVFKVKRQEHLSDFALNVNETIVSLITGGNGDFAVQFSNKRLFYGRAFVEHVVEIFLGEDPSSNFTVMFDIFSSLLLITSNGGIVKTRKLPLANEVLNAVFPQKSCPYLKFTTSVSPELYFMDKGDETKVWAVLIYPRTEPNDVRLEISSVDVLQITSEDHVEHYKGLVTLNKTFTFRYNFRNGTSVQKNSYISTAVAVQLLPKVGELSCENSLQVLHIHVGCPPLKSIVIRNCTSSTGVESAPPLSTDYGQNPCRLNAAIYGNIRLVVDLYEGDKFVEEVRSDYVVWEETGRTDYGYTATMSEVRCLSEAQTLRKLSENTSEDLNRIWTQNKYQSCFEVSNDGKTFHGSQPYEILNSSGVSQLVFQGSGSFHFQLRVVGNHLSFCELTSRFSVQVTDREGKNFLSQIASVAVVTLISTVLLYLNFAKYTKRTLNRHQADEQEQQRLQELKSLFTTFQQEDGAGVTHRRSTSHSVRRFTGTAMLMTNRLPEECLAETAKTFAEPIAESTEPSHTSLRSRKSLHTDN